MIRSILAGSAAACICLGLASPLFAAEPAANGTSNLPPPSEKAAASIKPAEKCLPLGGFQVNPEREPETRLDR